MGTMVTIVPRFYTFYGSNVLMLIFGLRMLKEASEMKGSEGMEELDEVTEELRSDSDADIVDPEAGNGAHVKSSEGITSMIRSCMSRSVGPVYAKAFILTF